MNERVNKSNRHTRVRACTHTHTHTHKAYMHTYCCLPNLSDGEHYFHSRNIMCVGGQRRYEYRSIDTDYQSNSIIVNVY